MNDRLINIAKISYSHCGVCEQPDKDEEQKISLEEAYSAPPGPGRRALRPLRQETCPLSSRDDDQDLLMEDLEQRIEAAIEGVQDAVTLLENAGMERDEATTKLVAILKSELEENEEGMEQDVSDEETRVGDTPAEIKGTEHFPEIRDSIYKVHDLIGKTLKSVSGRADFDSRGIEEIGNLFGEAEEKLYDLWNRLDPGPEE